MDDRKKKIEEARKRRAALQAQLQQDTQSGQRPIDTSTITSTKERKRDSAQQNPAFAELPKAINKKAHNTVQIFEDPTKNALLTEIYKKKISQSLSTSTYSDFLMGVFPSTAENSTQYEYTKEEEKKPAQKKEKEEDPNENRRSSVLKRGLSLNTEEEKKPDEDKKKKKKITDEMRLEFIQKNEEKLSQFLNAEKDMFEKAFLENDLFDICQTYYVEEDLDIDISKRQLVTTMTELYDESLCEGRAVTSLEWSTKQHDQLLTGFSKSNDLNERDGLILLWNLVNKKSEYTINCQTELTTSILNPFNANMIIAGNYIGQILIYDTKSKPVPVFKTQLGIKSETEKNDKNVVHTHQLPINCLGLTGTATNHTLISLSEGIMCIWSLANISKPLYHIDLKKNKIEDKYNLNQIKALSISFSNSQPDSVYLGSDYNEIFQISSLKGKNNEEIISTYKGHLGPVNSVDIHPGEMHNDVFISASSDWTTKLWHKNYTDPLMSFDVTDDYVYSAKWHPVNPSMFVTSDGIGHLDFWDLNKDLEVPTFRYEHKNCINKMEWYYDGKKMAVGDSTGKVSVLGIEKDLYSTKVDDSTKFSGIVTSLINSLHTKDD